MTLLLKKRLINVQEYHRMAEVGILTEEDKVELLNGEIIHMSPINTKHSSHVKRITSLLYDCLGKKATIGVQDPVVIPKFSEPEPDITILKYDELFYAEKHPHPQDVFILIEVSDSTLEKDRNVKLPIYAKAKIKEYWIVNLVDNWIEVYKNPVRNNYKHREIFHFTDEIELTDLKLTIKVSDILVE